MKWLLQFSHQLKALTAAGNFLLCCASVKRLQVCVLSALRVTNSNGLPEPKDGFAMSHSLMFMHVCEYELASSAESCMPSLACTPVFIHLLT